MQSAKPELENFYPASVRSHNILSFTQQREGVVIRITLILGEFRRKTSGFTFFFSFFIIIIIIIFIFFFFLFFEKKKEKKNVKPEEAALMLFSEILQELTLSL